MAHWIGLASVAVGLLLIYRGFAHRRAVAAGATAPPSSKMAEFGEMVRPLVYVALAYAAIKSSFAWAVMDAGRYLSVFDLAGFLFLLASYGVWLRLKTAPAAASVAAPPVEAREEPTTAPEAYPAETPQRKAA